MGQQKTHFIQLLAKGPCLLRRSEQKEFSLGPKVLFPGFACLQRPQPLLLAAITISLAYEKAAGQVLEETIQELIEHRRQLSELIGYRGIPLILLGSWRYDYGIFEI